MTAGPSEQEFQRISAEILEAWNRASSRDEGFRVIVNYGQKYGYKNVIAAIQRRTPKRYTREKSLDQWVDERHHEEAPS